MIKTLVVSTMAFFGTVRTVLETSIKNDKIEENKVLTKEISMCKSKPVPMPITTKCEPVIIRDTIPRSCQDCKELVSKAIKETEKKCPDPVICDTTPLQIVGYEKPDHTTIHLYTNKGETDLILKEIHIKLK